MTMWRPAIRADASHSSADRPSVEARRRSKASISPSRRTHNVAHNVEMPVRHEPSDRLAVYQQPSELGAPPRRRPQQLVSDAKARRCGTTHEDSTTALAATEDGRCRAACRIGAEDMIDNHVDLRSGKVRAFAALQSSKPRRTCASDTAPGPRLAHHCALKLVPDSRLATKWQDGTGRLRHRCHPTRIHADRGRRPTLADFVVSGTASALENGCHRPWAWSAEHILLLTSPCDA